MRYLELPYKVGGKKHLLTITVDSRIYTELTLEVGEEAEYSAYLPLPDGIISLSSPTGLDTEAFKITDTKPEGVQHFAFHYAPSFGWMNDPNGLHYENGLYHMYYQYNPLSREWGNMSWGHAVSRDLITWQELDPVMLPLSRNEQIFSGSAIIEGDETAFYYTLCTFDDDRNNTQRRRYSKDGGYTLLDDEIIIPPAGKGARDPKAFYYGGCEYIILYLEGNDFAIYRKADEGWKKLSTFSADEAWECPDLFFIDDKVVFTSADGFYWLAAFDGEKITLLSERNNMFLTKLPYASQSFFGTNGRTVIVPWLRVQTPTLASKGAMGLPREVELDENGKLHIPPVAEFRKLIEKPIKIKSDRIRTDKSAFTLKIDSSSSFSGVINGNHVEFHNGKLSISSNEVDFSSNSIILIVDGLLLEVSDDTYLENAYFELEEKTEPISELVFAEECTMELAVIEE